MPGINRTSGLAIGSTAHIAQSITDILTTPVGTRVKRRDYGSLLPELIDQPLTETLILQVYAASVIAIAEFEPRVSINAIDLVRDGHRVELVLDLFRHDGSSSNLNVVVGIV